MKSRLSRIVVVVLSLLVVASLVLAAVGYTLPRRSFPQVKGDLQVAGLQGPVEILRDAEGIPHIYAASQHDLFFAQGYVHAQDRFWQMDFWRHIGSGRLAEMFGEGQAETDAFLRTLGWARVVQEEMKNYDENTKNILEAYSAGVNAYLAGHKGSALSLEYAVLKLINSNYTIEPWQPLHTLTWAKAMAWDLRGNMDEEIQRAKLLKTLSPEQVAELMPPYSADAPVIVPGTSTSTGAEDPKAASYSPQALAALEAARQNVERLAALMGPSGTGIGSNNWVISGKLTDTGMPLLANDPHLGVQMPSIWYEIGLHCTQKGEDCPYNVTGFSFAGAPGVIIGHNDRIAWGFTNVGPDVQDLYIEKINPANPDQYEVNGQWQDMTKVQETIQVAGGDPVNVTVRYTRHGPVISETYGSLEQFDQKSGVSLPQGYAIALRWTALDPTRTFTAIWQMDRAQNWDDFRQAASNFDVPSQNFVYADVDGNIGYQMPGKVPIRAGGDGTLPVPGWTDANEWTGFIPFDKLPQAYNPPQGYIATANNAVVGPDYPYMITKDWDYGFRARRIVEMIENAPGKISKEYIQQMQGDDKNLIAEQITPVLLQISVDKSYVGDAIDLLQGWDYQNKMDSAPAALYAAFWKHLLADTFADELNEDQDLPRSSQGYEVLRSLMQQPDSAWWDNRTTADVENRDEILSQALTEAVNELEKTLGKDPAKWQWGELHTVTFRNATLGESGIAPIEALFNRGPFQAAGGNSIVNATSWDESGSYKVGWLPSMRMIVDLSNLDSSLTINTTGQSGHAYHPQYINMADRWRTIQYHPMLWSRSQVEANTAARLTLHP